MKKAVVAASGLAAALMVSGLARAEGDAALTLVRALPRGEIAQGNLVHAGRLWVSVTSEQEGVKDKIFVYDAEGTKEERQIQLVHTATQIYPYGPDAILVIGRSQWPWKSHYTVIKGPAGAFAQTTYTFPEQYLMQEFAGGAKDLYFTEIGDAKVYRKDGRGITTVADGISGPGSMVLVGDKLWGIERRSFNLGDENVFTIGVRDGSGVTRLPNALNGDGFATVTYHVSANRVAVSEYNADQVRVFNPATGEAVNVAVPGGPWGMTEYGRCLAVVTDREKSVQVVDMGQEPYEVFARLDVSAGGELLKKPRQVTVNPATGAFFVRSAYPCPSCVPNTQSSVFKVVDVSGEVAKRCNAQP